ncbi:hypothetical protein HDA32_003956 [Spinactinospora alkalitolerans]|uniref:Phosphodiester glycosidase domain-containing protein n=1 Tax=Spinactinospora alkalitolerans TaxID=687207 RepID=A0A852TWE8_9ACTN|nr:phosphodiester glycosidase family protein [Spinactinospora alkalitolerans]NYE48836.1 hypothetical protein [Spinactinospora alkalitolerans]
MSGRAVGAGAAITAIALVSALSPALTSCAPVSAATAATARSRPVAPGVELTSTNLEGAEPQRFTTLSVDLDGGARVGYLSGGSVTDAAPLTEQAAQAGAVAAVNGDFFDIGGSLAPLGPAVRGGEVVKSPSVGRSTAVTIDAGGVGRVQDLLFDGTAALPDGEVRIDRLNSHEIPVDGIGAFTSLWGAHPRGRAVRGADRVREVVIADGRVTEVRDAAGAGAPSGTVLVGREAGADRLAGLRRGDEVAVDYALTADGAGPRTAIGGRNVLLRGGEVAFTGASAREPRTAVGFSADGTEMYVVTADGRHAGGRGATLRQMGERLRAAGAEVGLELDGGGSSTLVARTPGGGNRIENRTGEAERAVPNGLAVYAPEGSGEARGLWVRPRIDPLPDPGPSAPVLADPHRVFSGLTRALDATAHDEAYGPVSDPVPAGEIEWSADSGSAEKGSYTAAEPGTALVTARSGDIAGEAELEVLPAPERIEATVPAVALPDGSSSATFGLTGIAPDGTRAPIEPADASLDYDRDLVAVTARGDGVFEVEPAADDGSGTIAVSVGGKEVVLPVHIGAEERTIAAFDDAADWTAASVGGSAAVSGVKGREGRGLRLSYDFTGSTATRAAYALPPARLAVDGHISELSLWVKGDDRDGMLAITVTDGDGLRRSLYGPRIAWEGWRRADVDVTGGLAQPISVDRVYVVETRSGERYSGGVVFDDLTADVTPIG